MINIELCIYGVTDYPLRDVLDLLCELQAWGLTLDRTMSGDIYWHGQVDSTELERLKLILEEYQGELGTMGWDVEHIEGATP